MDKDKQDCLKPKLGFCVPFNSQDHIGTGLQLCHLWDLNPHRGDNLRLDTKPGLTCLTTTPLRTKRIVLSKPYFNIQPHISYNFIKFIYHMIKHQKYIGQLG